MHNCRGSGPPKIMIMRGPHKSWNPTLIRPFSLWHNTNSSNIIWDYTSSFPYSLLLSLKWWGNITDFFFFEKIWFWYLAHDATKPNTCWNWILALHLIYNRKMKLTHVWISISNNDLILADEKVVKLVQPWIVTLAVFFKIYKACRLHLFCIHGATTKFRI